MQFPEIPDPFKDERKLRKYENGETLLERRIGKKARLEIETDAVERKTTRKHAKKTPETILLFSTSPPGSIMSPALPNMRTFESMVVRIEQEFVDISFAIVADLLDTLQALVDELDEEFLWTCVYLI
jgi:hypothetical protein